MNLRVRINLFPEYFVAGRTTNFDRTDTVWKLVSISDVERTSLMFPR